VCCLPEPSSQNSRATANMCRRSAANSDGSQTALAILFDDVDATNGDVIAAAIIARGRGARR